MNYNSISENKYHVGGSLPVNASTYVVRQADRKLLQGVESIDLII